ncbi:YihY/virulence factor BrkB family protein [Mycobacterium sp. 852013-50091_SCH5140682]|uniref:YihY/virulence factor BrkB family protein n=1 Tax=Mycobacterium sp. 852013-50091_SCH5140682 TaxID=1834109 RepID=UPI000A6458CD|nr:YihY/virulence factor BrkB family protein [Mycobacterium sp. 852013-50091_SCH5140682]
MTRTRTENEEEHSKEKDRAPDPVDPRKPDSPDDLTRASWRYVLRKTAREFSEDQCTDLAAALTYYAMLSLFPSLLVMVSLLGVFGQGQRTVDALMDAAGSLAPASALDIVRPSVEQVVESPSAGLTLILGVLGALWSASSYIRAFGRSMNRIYEITEGRPAWKLRPMQLLLTLGALVLAAAVAIMLAVSGPVAAAIGRTLGLGDVAQTLWAVVKWPVLLVFVSVAVAILYYTAPNVRQPKFRWLSIGSAVAIAVWVLASVGFGFYVSNFASYNKTYGALGGVIVFLLWLWLTNLALLFGAELDAELERGRQLRRAHR